MSSYSPLISAADLATRLGDPDWAVVDCRFALADPGWGEREYRAGHIAGAVYAHLDRDLSGPIVPGETGRHPLPAPDDLARKLSAWGIGRGVRVVAYDAAGGALAASRLWWLLGWLGHDDAQVLDGGWPAWQAWAADAPDEPSRPSIRPEEHGSGRDEPGPDGRHHAWLRRGVESRPPRAFTPQIRPDWVVDAAGVARLIAAGRPVFDARGADRYRGENESIDPVAGHIPGARSLPFAGDLAPDGRFLGDEALRARFEAALGGTAADDAAVYCGSGVTAAHIVLAMRQARLGTPRLYAGSWSEWIISPERPVAVGDEFTAKETTPAGRSSTLPAGGEA